MSSRLVNERRSTAQSSQAPDRVLRIEGRELRPLGVGEVLDVSINLYFRNLGKLLTAAAAIAVPMMAIIIFLDLGAFNETDVTNPDAALYQVGDSLRILDESNLALFLVLRGIVNAIGYLLIIGVVFRIVSALYLHTGSTDVRESVRFAASRLHSLLWLSFLLILAIGIGLVLLVIPGIWILVAASVAVPVLMVEGVRGSKAVNRSFSLVEKNWWRTFAALLVGIIFIGLLTFLLDLLAGLSDGVARDSLALWVVIRDALAAITTIITAPLQAAIVTVIYFNLRVRKEGFDIAVRAAEIESHPLSQPPPSQPPPAV